MEPETPNRGLMWADLLVASAALAVAWFGLIALASCFTSYPL